MKKYLAEMVGTMVLVLMGCGSAVFAGSVAGGVGAGVGTIGVALAFGLSVVAMAYTIGNVSGCHINPAITFGVFLSGRMSGREAAAYMVAQVIGAIVGSAILYALTASGSHGGPTATGANSFADGMMLQAFIAEAVFTFIFVLVVLGATDAKQGAGNLGGSGHRSDAGAGTHRLHPDYGDVGQSGPLDWPGPLRGGHGARAGCGSSSWRRWSVRRSAPGYGACSPTNGAPVPPASGSSGRGPAPSRQAQGRKPPARHHDKPLPHRSAGVCRF